MNTPLSTFLAILACFLCFSAARAAPGVTISDQDIGGVVKSPNGPEAGVWVIAETRDLPTRYAKIVVTDDQGRFVIPELPKAHYQVWVRGYGLVDSPKVSALPGQILELRAVLAPDKKSCSRILPRCLLVLDAGYPKIERVSGYRGTRKRHSFNHEVTVLLGRHP